MKAVILAAGRGSRLAPYSDILPKPLMPVRTDASSAFIPIIDVLVRQLTKAAVKEMVCVVNYKGEMLVQHLGDGSKLNTKMSFVFQETLDGNAGAFYRASHLVQGDDVIITDSDNHFTDDEVFKKMAERHVTSSAAITVGVSRVSTIKKFAIIKTDQEGKAIDIYEKPSDESEWGNLAKSGMMILSPEIAALDKSISKTETGEYTTTEIIRYCIRNSLKVELFNIQDGFNDIGTWAEYTMVLKANL